MDSTIVAVPFPVDSAAVHGWIAPYLSKWLAFLPAEAIVAVIGFVVAFLLDAAEDVWSLLMKNPTLQKLLGWIGIIKEKFPKAVGAGSALGVGWLLTGSPIGGVIAAGVRSMIAKGSLTTATAEGVKKLKGAVIVGTMAVALLLVTSYPAKAQDDAAPLPWLSSDRFALALGVGYDYEHFAGLEYAPPKAWAEAKLSYAVADAVALQLGYERPVQDMFDGARYRITTRAFLVLPLPAQFGK